MRACISPLHCMTVSLASGGAGLGTLIGERGAAQLATQAGFHGIEKIDVGTSSQFFYRLTKA